MQMRRRCFSEFLATFVLMFAGTGAIIANDQSNGAVTHVGVCLTWGLAVLAMIYTLGEVSGAHMNPAVTIGFWLSRRFSGRDILPYVASQIAGALSASAVLRVLFPGHPNLGSSAPSGTVMQSFVYEFIMTFILMFVILNVSTGAKKKGITAGIVVGAVITIEALFGGLISGTSLNPARSLAPALVSGKLQHLWLYLTAPVLGAGFAVVACRFGQLEDCCTIKIEEKSLKASRV